MPYFLAIDGGGTKTQVWCADEHSNVLGEGLAGPTNFTVVDLDTAQYHLRTALTQATQHLPVGAIIQSAVMGLAGVDTPEELIQAEQFFSPVLHEFGAKNLKVVNDVVIALASGSEAANAIALIAGTGSNCYGHDASGRVARAGGLDYLLADEGSGYAIGLAVLHAATQSFDERGPKTLLEKLVCDHFGVSAIDELKQKIYHPPLSKTQLSELAKVCETAQLAGDETAVRIFDQAVADLSAMVNAVVERLGLFDTSAECIFVGGVSRIPYVSDKLDQVLSQPFPLLKVIHPKQPPVFGALRLALKIVSV